MLAGEDRGSRLGGRRALGERVQLERLDHVGIAVADLDAAVVHYERAFGCQVAHEQTLDDQGVREVLFSAGDSWIQLLAPLRPDSPVGRFLARRGEGVHHVGYAVASVAGTLEHLRAEGIELVDEVPRIGSGGTTIAFVHPKASLGVLVELVEEGSGHRDRQPRS